MSIFEVYGAFDANLQLWFNMGKSYPQMVGKFLHCKLLWYLPKLLGEKRVHKQCRSGADDAESGSTLIKKIQQFLGTITGSKIGSHESPKYRNTTKIPVKNIGIPVKDTY